jgi:hypothetical protein
MLTPEVGQKVRKISGKPFKSGNKVGTVKRVEVDPKLDFSYKARHNKYVVWVSFEEDDSLVEAGRLELVGGELYE